MKEFLTAAFYKFVDLPDFRDLRAPVLAACEAHGIKGTILLAHEGVNGTIAGELKNVRAVLTIMRQDPRLADLQHKEAFAPKIPFYRMKVLLKREIVTMGVPEIRPSEMAGTYVKPAEWNKLIEDPNVILIDTRNDYEVAIGTFEGAIDPKLKSFSELPAWLREQAALREKPKVAMFCTGGIRCEKSTAFLRGEGFDEVYHLEGGILKYLETVPEEQSRWKGECFVFDERVSVGHGLVPGPYELCRSCRHPLGPEEKHSEHYVVGVSCSRCYDKKTEKQKKAFAERQRQVLLADRRNQAHIGARQVRSKKHG
jgi:UPF0176 protein